MAQPQASGEAPFSPRCIERDIVEVTVPSSDGVFETGEVQVSARLRAGPDEEGPGFEVMRVGPIVTVALADVGRLEDGGAATVIDVTVACPVGSTGQQSPVFLYPSQGFYLPTCDGSSHTFSVRLERSQRAVAPVARRGRRLRPRRGGRRPVHRLGSTDGSDHRGLRTPPAGADLDGARDSPATGAADATDVATPTAPWVSAHQWANGGLSGSAT